MPTYKAVVVGAGRIGMRMETDSLRPKPASHAGLWASRQETELVGLCDPNPSMPSEAANIVPGVPTYDDVEVMFNEQKPDIVSIATHQDLHVPLILQALKHGVKAIVSEKPISDDNAAAKHAIEECRKSNVHLIVNHARRFDPHLNEVASDIQSGLIGELLQVSCKYVFGIVSTGTHVVDTLRMFLGDKAGEPSWVAAWPVGFDSFHPDTDPNLDGLVGFTSGLKATFQALNMKDYDFMEIDLLGRKGRILCHSLARQADFFPVVPSKINTGFTEVSATSNKHYGPPNKSFFDLMGDNVIGCLEGTQSPASTGDDSLIALKILNAMRSSAEQNGKVIHL